MGSDLAVKSIIGGHHDDPTVLLCTEWKNGRQHFTGSQGRCHLVCSASALMGTRLDVDMLQNPLRYACRLQRVSAFYWVCSSGGRSLHNDLADQEDKAFSLQRGCFAASVTCAAGLAKLETHPNSFRMVSQNHLQQFP